MKILVLENVIRQTKLSKENGKKPISKEVLELIFNELENLVNIESEGGFQSLYAYLKMNNGKELKSAAEHVWKYRLNDGDRILYTWGKYLPYLQGDDKESLVLIAFATHDDQGRAGKNEPSEQHYEDAKVILKLRSQFTEDDFTNDGIVSPDNYDAICDIIFEDSYQANHTIYIADSETLANTDLSYLDFKLSPKQSSIIEEYAQKPQPTLILGGAGTGKTVVAVHFLNDYSSSNCAYFTQSKELLNSVKNRYGALTKHENTQEPAFWDINEYCRNILTEGNWSRKNFVETNQFLNEFVAKNKRVLHILDKCNLTPMDLWTEIRGVIKGFTSPKWTRTKPLNQQDLASEDIKNFKELEKTGFIQRNPINKQLFTLVPDYENVDYTNLSQQQVDLLERFAEYFQSFDPSIHELDLEDYKLLDEEISMVEKSNRDSIYQCFREYKQWLNSNNFYDDNDLAINAIAQLQDTSLGYYDFIVVDEIQDYTEVQIYLIYSLAKEVAVEKWNGYSNETFKVKPGIVFAGDSKQIINPTVFNERKLSKLFYNPDAGSELNVERLEQNFRCQQEVVELANRISTYRKEYIAAQKHDVEEVGLRQGEKPMSLTCTPNNINLLLKKLIKYPNVAILVPNDKCRQKLIDNFGRKDFEEQKNSFIYTVSEIKGMEYRYVVSFDMLTEYNDLWKEITSGKTNKKTRFRYYFNMFYVSVTRAQEYLCILESSVNNSFYSKLKSESSLIEPIEKFNIERLFLDRLSNDDTDWYEDAVANEDAGNYERAVESYQNANADMEHIWRCMAKNAEKTRHFDDAVKYLLVLESSDSKINKKDYLAKYTTELDENSDVRKLTEVFLHPENFYKEQIDLNNALKRIYGNSESPEYVSALNELVMQFNNYMKSLLENLQERSAA